MTRTPNLQLCQWAPTDVVDVDQVNENFEKLDATGVRLDGAASRMDGIDAQLHGVATRLNAADTSFGAINTRFNGVDARMNGIDTRLGGVDAKLAFVGRVKLYETVTSAPAEAVVASMAEIDYNKWFAIHVSFKGPSDQSCYATMRFTNWFAGSNGPKLGNGYCSPAPAVATIYCMYHADYSAHVHGMIEPAYQTTTTVNALNICGDMVLSSPHGATLPAGIKVEVWGEL